MPKISIIVPVYKVEKYLRRCLDSIVAQTFTDWECILVDDGSPDNSGKICDEYAGKDNRFRVFHQENQGVSAARNKGLDEAKGEWITFIDSDDWIEKEMLAELYDCAVKNEAEVVLSGLNITDGKTKGEQLKIKNGELSMPTDFTWTTQGPCAKLFKRTILCKYNIRFPNGFAIAEDLYFTFKVYWNTDKIWGMDKIFYNYFQNEKSAVHTISKEKIQDEVKIISMIEQIIHTKQSNVWNDFLKEKKLKAKNAFLLCFSEIDCQSFRNTFPEVNKFSLYTPNIMKKIVYVLIFFHCDFLAKLFIKIHNRKRSIIRKQKYGF